MKTYWGNNGTYQSIADRLNKLVPFHGPIKGKQNRKLDRFRRASNAYYDLFNNGGGNRAREIWGFFKVSMRNRATIEGVHEIVEPIMDKIILDAAAEQMLPL
jgi:hypothetical protein